MLDRAVSLFVASLGRLTCFPLRECHLRGRHTAGNTRAHARRAAGTNRALLRRRVVVAVLIRRNRGARAISPFISALTAAFWDVIGMLNDNPNSLGFIIIGVARARLKETQVSDWHCHAVGSVT
jgi:hypothetical protein